MRRLGALEINILPAHVVKRIVHFLPAQESSRLHRCSRRLHDIVRLPFEPQNSRLTFTSCKAMLYAPETSLRLCNISTGQYYVGGFEIDFTKMAHGLRSPLMAPYLETARLIVNHSRFDEEEISNELFQVFNDAPLIDELYSAYCVFDSYDYFCHFLDTIKARRYTLRTASKVFSEYVTRYRESHPDVAIQFQFVQ